MFISIISLYLSAYHNFSFYKQYLPISLLFAHYEFFKFLCSYSLSGIYQFEYAVQVLFFCALQILVQCMVVINYCMMVLIVYTDCLFSGEPNVIFPEELEMYDVCLVLANYVLINISFKLQLSVDSFKQNCYFFCSIMSLIYRCMS